MAGYDQEDESCQTQSSSASGITKWALSNFSVFPTVFHYKAISYTHMRACVRSFQQL